MLASPFFRLLVMTLTVLQLAGPGLLWAVEQRGVEVRRHNQAVVSGIRGSDLTVSAGETTRPVRFSEPIVFGEQVRTARDSSAEVLINNQAVVTLLSESDVALEERDGHTVVHLTKGSVLVSAAASALREGQTVIVETLGAQLATRGGLLKATVGTEPRQTERKQESEGRAQLVSYSPVYPVQTEAILNERFEVYEGTGTIGTRTAGATPLVIEPGQSVQMTGGILGTPSGIEGALAGTGPMLLAATHHAATPQAGLDLVSQRQMQQVSALQQALYGDPDAAVEGKESQSGTIISTLFGTNPTQTNSSSNPNNPAASLFGTGSPYTAALLAAINRAGTGIGDDGNDTAVSLNFTTSSFSCSSCALPIEVNGGAGLLTITKQGADKLSSFKTTELLLVDAGVPGEAPHGGRIPISTLVARGIQDRNQFQIPQVTPGSSVDPTKIESLRVGITAPEKLTFGAYEIKILSFTEGSSLPFQFPVSPSGQFEVLDTHSGKVVQTDSLRFEPSPLTGKADKTSIFGVFDGLNVSLRINGAPTVGDKYNVSSISSTPIKVNGNTGIAINRGYITNGIVDGSSNAEERLGRLEAFILRAPQDTRLPANSTLDTINPNPAGNLILADFSSRPDGKACSNCSSFFGSEIIEADTFRYLSFADARVIARQASGSTEPAVLAGGVVLTGKTSITVTNEMTRGQENYTATSSRVPSIPSATETYFRQHASQPGFEGSVAAIVANGSDPTFVRIQDRVLGVLDGSEIKPDVVNGQEIRTALLGVLDSQLLGPVVTPTSLVGAKEVTDFFTGTARLEGGQIVPNRKNGEIPPLLEIVDSTVKATSAVVVRATEAGIGRFTLDRALLDASAPILTLVNSHMDATGHLVDLAGKGPNGRDLLSANLLTTDPAIPRDALVRLDRGSTLNINGNLLNLANGAGASLTGYLFSIANGSTLDIKGTLFSLKGNSVFRLNSDAFGIFGEGTNNTLALRNTLCAGGECGVLTDHTGAEFQFENKPIRVSGVGGAKVQLPQEFLPFRSPNGTLPNLVIEEQAALFHVEPGSELHINNVPVVRR